LQTCWILLQVCCKLALYIVLSMFLTVLRRIELDILKKYKEEEKEDIMLVMLYMLNQFQYTFDYSNIFAVWGFTEEVIKHFIDLIAN